jgi:hypothetical protein
MGEDRVWLDLLQNHHGAGIARAFWLLNDRNPLSPWWYFLVSPLVVNFDYGIYLVRKVVDLFLAGSVFLLLSQMFGPRLRAFCLATSIFILLWNFSYFYTEQIMWNFLIALAIGNLSLWSYLKFLDSGRTKSGYLSVSLVLYLATLGSYTIQCGAPIAVMLLSLLRGPYECSAGRLPTEVSSAESLPSKVRNALGDGAPFLAILAVYMLSWITTTRVSSDYYELSPVLILKQFLPSLKNLLWHDDYTYMWLATAREWNAWVLGGAFAASASLSYWFIRKFIVASVLANGRSLPKHAWTWLWALLLSVSLPTLLLESMSATWYPGTRIRMITQMISPCSTTGVISLIAVWLAGRTKVSVASHAFSFVLAAFFAFAFCCGLQYNKQMCLQTEFEKRLARGLECLVNPNLDHQYFLVRLDGVDWNCSPFLQDQWIRTALKNKHVSLRILQTKQGPKEFQRLWRIKLGDRDKGIQHPAFETESQYMPWDMVPILAFDGRNLRVIDPVTPKEFAGLQVDCQFTYPIKQIVLPRCRPQDRIIH